MRSKKKQTNEFDEFFDDDFEVIYDNLDELGGYLNENDVPASDDYEDYDGYNGDTDYYDDYDDYNDYDDDNYVDYDDDNYVDYDDDYDDDDYDDYDNYDNYDGSYDDSNDSDNSYANVSKNKRDRSRKHKQSKNSSDKNSKNGKNRKDTKNKRQPKNTSDNSEKNATKKRGRKLPNVGKPVANVAKTGINATKKLVGTVLRAATLILIALIILVLLKAFLSNAGTYGKILLLGQTKDATLIAYLIVGAVLIGYELLNFFWAASRTRARSRNNNRLDTGRGLISFIVIYAGSYVAAIFSHLIPASPSWLTGVQGGLSIYVGLKATLLPLCIAGVVSCVIRKIIVR